MEGAGLWKERKRDEKCVVISECVLVSILNGSIAFKDGTVTCESSERLEFRERIGFVSWSRCRSALRKKTKLCSLSDRF